LIFRECSRRAIIIFLFWSWPPASAPQCASSNSSRPISATRTRVGPMPALPMNSWRGARALACRRSAPSSRCTLRRGLRPGRASSRRRAVTCSTGSSPARWCQSTRRRRWRGPRHVVTSGQTPVLDPAEARALLDSIDVSTHAGLRDRALIGLWSIPSPVSARHSAWQSKMSTRRTAAFGCGCARRAALRRFDPWFGDFRRASD
jgi:hypothetical protein